MNPRNFLGFLGLIGFLGIPYLKKSFSNLRLMLYHPPMIYALTGTVHKLDIPQISVNVSGVSYLVTVPYPLWDNLREGAEATVTIYTHVREDRLDLFGFANAADRSLFVELLNLSGIGPKTALELCSLPQGMLMGAVQEEDVAALTEIKGIGKKTAEKLLVDLKSLLEKHPEWIVLPTKGEKPAAFDSDAISALTSLGYDQATVVDALKRVPPTLKKTEERVAAALRSL